MSVYPTGTVLAVVGENEGRNIMAPIAGINSNDVFAAVQGAKNVGWESHVSTQYTSVAPLSSLNDRTVLTIRHDDSNIDQLPENETPMMHQGNLITCREEGAMLLVRLNFTMESGNDRDFFTIAFNIDGVDVASTTLNSPRLVGGFEFVSVVMPLFVSASFAGNDCAMFLDTSNFGSNIYIYDLSIVVQKTYSPSGRA